MIFDPLIPRGGPRGQVHIGPLAIAGIGAAGSALGGLLGGKGKVKASPAFQPMVPLGQEYGNFLRSRLAGNVTDMPEYELLRGRLRDDLTTQSEGLKQQIGEGATAAGNYDSGARLAALGNVDRGFLQSYSQGMSEILLGLEEQRTSMILPYLSIGVTDRTGAATADVQARGQGLQFASNLTSDALRHYTA
jgi:hypothetical protein